MNNGRLKIWFPTICTSSGTDVFTERLVNALQEKDVDAVITWFPHWYEIVPVLLSRYQVPDNVDVIHANSWTAFPFKRRHIPMVVTLHHAVTDPAFRPYKSFAQHLYHKILIERYERRSLECADSITTVSRYTMDCVHRLYGHQDITVIANWVDSEKYSLPLITSENPEFIVLFVGNSSKRKGVDLLAPIMSKLGPGYRLVIVGGLRNEKKYPALPENTEFYEKITEAQLVELYRRADVVLVPSRLEGFGYSAVEGQSCGTPVVATRGSSLQEVIEDGVTGILCEQDNAQEYAEAISRICSNGEFRHELSVKGRERVKALYNKEILIDKYIRVYRELVRN